MTQPGPNEQFAVNLAALAREIAMDIFPIEQIKEMHRLSDEEWTKIHEQPHFQQMLTSMVVDWNAALNVRERMKVHAQIGLEANIAQFVIDIGDPEIPLAQRVECAKFLARIGELDNTGGAGGGGFSITMNIGATTTQVEGKPMIDVTPGAIPT